jgi:hypothetical protein
LYFQKGDQYATVFAVQISNTTFVGASIAGLLAAAIPLYLSANVAADNAVIKVSQVKAGQKGYGLTVFSGTKPEKFDIEVLSVIHNFIPHQDLILLRTDHPRLQKVNVVAGMSGSPIYIAETPGATPKLAGAYVYGWGGGNEPVAGVTPIENMRSELGRPLSPLLLPKAGGAPLAGGGDPVTPAPLTDRTNAFVGDPGSYSMQKHIEQITQRFAAKTAGSPQPVESPLILGGFGDHAVQKLSKIFEPMGMVPMQGGGGGGSTTSASDLPKHFVDGGAIAVQLVRGDLSAQATGTVTEVLGNKLLAFGHPMNQAGASVLPTAIAEIHWVVSSILRSFKIGEPVVSLGTLIQNRQPCIVVDENIKPPMIAINFDVAGDATAPKTHWGYEISADKFQAPLWAMVTTANVIEATISDHTDASWVIRTKFKVKDKGTFTIEDFGVSGEGVNELMWMFSRQAFALAEMLNNPWQELTVEKMETEFDVKWARNITHMMSAQLLDPTVVAGHSARVRLHTKSFQGKESSLEVAIPIEKSLAGKDIEIEIVPGWSVMPPAAAPTTIDQLLTNVFAATENPKQFVVQYKLPDVGVATSGHVEQQLSPFAQSILKTGSETAVVDSVFSYKRVTVDAGGYAEGTTKLRLTVK